MLDITQVQKKIYKNKVAKGFNTSDIYREFCYLHGELTEACEAYMQKKSDLGEELADVAIYLLGLAEILGVNLEHEILMKIDKNEKRQYMQKDGANIRIEDGNDPDCYICEHGHVHNYCNFNLADYENEMATAKTYTNLAEMWADLDAEDDN